MYAYGIRPKGGVQGLSAEGAAVSCSDGPLETFAAIDEVEKI